MKWLVIIPIIIVAILMGRSGNETIPDADMEPSQYDTYDREPPAPTDYEVLNERITELEQGR